MRSNLQVSIEKQRAVYNHLRRTLLAQLLRTHNLTIREFAEICGISKSYAQQIVNHEKFPSLELGIKISRYFECTVEELFGWRVDDSGERRPLIVELPHKVLIRLKAKDRGHSAMQLMKYISDALKKKDGDEKAAQEGDEAK